MMASDQNPINGSDPLIDEVRELRRRASEAFDHDLDRLVDHLRKLEAEWPGRKAKPRDEQGTRPNNAAA